MKLDRNINSNGRGKYALLKLRRLTQIEQNREVGHACAAINEDVKEAIRTLEAHGVLDWGDTIESEFMVIRLKDKYAGQALSVYGTMATHDDPEYGHEILRMADRAGSRHPNCKKPD